MNNALQLRREWLEQSMNVYGFSLAGARLNLGGKVVSRPAMLYDSARIILPAYGTCTGGLRHDARALDRLMRDGAIAVLTGPTPTAIPMRRKTGGNANGPESPDRN